MQVGGNGRDQPTITNSVVPMAKALMVSANRAMGMMQPPVRATRAKGARDRAQCACDAFAEKPGYPQKIFD